MVLYQLFRMQNSGVILPETMGFRMAGVLHPSAIPVLLLFPGDGSPGYFFHRCLPKGCTIPCGRVAHFYKTGLPSTRLCERLT
jgi:hypothetical protein